MFGALGNTGAAFALMQLAKALEGAAPDQRVLLCSYGNGADALALATTSHVSGVVSGLGVGGHLARRRNLPDYAAYLRMRELGPTHAQPGGGMSSTVHFRERDADIAFVGGRCTHCETAHFPAQRVCIRCHRRDEFARLRLSDRRGRVMSYTFDHFHPAPEPPTVAGIVDIDGCRVYLMMADVDPDDVRCDLPVEFSFRKIHGAGNKPNYFWKATPCTTLSATK